MPLLALNMEELRVDLHLAQPERVEEGPARRPHLDLSLVKP